LLQWNEGLLIVAMLLLEELFYRKDEGCVNENEDCNLIHVSK
jgi:hypothetical protein